MTDLDELVPVHQAYVEVVREVARSEDVPIVDLARLFDKMPYETVRDRYISGDGIHYEDAGNKKIAEILYEHLIRYDLVDVLR
jgi:lysophospholipase L1-like esterase